MLKILQFYFPLSKLDILEAKCLNLLEISKV